MLTMKGTSDAASAGSSELVDSPPAMPARKVPPLTGPSARAAEASSVLAIAAEMPIAEARPMNSRRLIWPRAARRSI